MIILTYETGSDAKGFRYEGQHEGEGERPQPSQPPRPGDQPDGRHHQPDPREEGGGGTNTPGAQSANRHGRRNGDGRGARVPARMKKKTKEMSVCLSISACLSVCLSIYFKGEKKNYFCFELFFS